MLPGIALAQSVYTWTDEKGVIHFADEAPPDVKNVEKRALEAPQPLIRDEQAEGTPGEVIEVATPVPEPTVQSGKIVSEGPARVVLTQRKAIPEGAETRHLIGEVKNIGGETATRVAIIIKVTDADQGSECVSGEVAIDPETLEPGQDGTYDDYVDTPCFLGNASIEITPIWR